MTGPTQMISVRLTEEEVFLLDSLIGLDGMRNRSDVLRRGMDKIHEENKPENIGRQINVNISPAVSQDLKLIKEMEGLEPSAVVAMGTGLILEQVAEKRMARREAAYAVLKDVEDQGPHRDHIE